MCITRVSVIREFYIILSYYLFLSVLIVLCLPLTLDAYILTYKQFLLNQD